MLRNESKNNTIGSLGLQISLNTCLPILLPTAMINVIEGWISGNVHGNLSTLETRDLVKRPLLKTERDLERHYIII